MQDMYNLLQKENGIAVNLPCTIYIFSGFEIALRAYVFGISYVPGKGKTSAVYKIDSLFVTEIREIKNPTYGLSLYKSRPRSTGLIPHKTFFAQRSISPEVGSDCAFNSIK